MYLAIDIGGTKTLIALFSAHGHILKRTKFKTANGSKTFLRELSDHLQPFRKTKPKSISIAVPGVVHKNYTVTFGNRNWVNFDLLTSIKDLFTCPIFIKNDADLAAFYEASGLAGRTVYLTFSTGIGGGIVENGELLPASQKFEPGHEIYEFNGKTKEWEDIAATSAINAAYHLDDIKKLHDPKAMEDIASRIALGLPAIVKKFHPQNLIIGGAVSYRFPAFSKYLPQNLNLTYKRAKRPTESTIYGCYLFAKAQS